MRAALLLSGYALAVAWWAPALLSRLCARYGLGLTAVTLLLAGAPALLAFTLA